MINVSRHPMAEESIAKANGLDPKNGTMTSKHATKLLFICSRNKIRSLTAEKILEGVPGYEARSAGTQSGARIVATGRLMRWADIIFCMEKSHLQKIRGRFPQELEGRRLITLHIPDEYEFMGEDLLDELRAKLAPYVTFPDEG